MMVGDHKKIVEGIQGVLITYVPTVQYTSHRGVTWQVADQVSYLEELPAVAELGCGCGCAAPELLLARRKEMAI